MIDLKQGDCLELMKEIPDKSVDMVLCDLPYSVTDNDWDNIIPFEKLWEQYNRIIKDEHAIVLFGTEPFSSKLRMSNLSNYKYDWVWNKKKGGNFFNLKQQPYKIHENIIVFNSTKKHYFPQMTKQIRGKSRVYSQNKNFRSPNYTNQKMKDYKEKFPQSIIEFSNANQHIKRFHPTQKPVALLEYLIKTYTQKNDVVLDNCMGSGSTGVACINTNRKFIGYELQQDYFEIAEKRINDVIDTRGLFATDEQIARQKR